MKTVYTLSLSFFFMLSIQVQLYASEFEYIQFPKGLVFSVEINEFEDPLKPTDLKGYPVLMDGFRDGKYIYQLGAYKDFVEADLLSKKLEDEFKNVEIVAYFNRKPIKMDDGIALANNYNEVLIGHYPEPEASADSPPFRSVYSVQVGVFSSPKSSDLFNLDDVNELKQNQKFIYLYGEFSSVEEAKQALSTAKQKGNADAFVIQYDKATGERKPVSR